MCWRDVEILSNKRFVSLIQKIPFSKNMWRCVAMLTVCMWVTAELWEPAGGTGTSRESGRRGGHWSECPWFLWKWAWSFLKLEMWVSAMWLRESAWVSRGLSGECSLSWARRNWAAALLSLKKAKGRSCCLLRLLEDQREGDCRLFMQSVLWQITDTSRNVGNSSLTEWKTFLPWGGQALEAEGLPLWVNPVWVHCPRTYSDSPDLAGISALGRFWTSWQSGILPPEIILQF